MRSAGFAARVWRMFQPWRTPDAPGHLRRRQGVLSRIAAAQEGAGCGHSLFAVKSAAAALPSRALARMPAAKRRFSAVAGDPMPSLGLPLGVDGGWGR